ncbi:MAG: protein kinase [Chloroflexi bacterium]|nr:protein kinase [Chloroflexota bacterium]
MSTVYLAHDPRFHRDVAIKLLPHELLHHPTFRARFEREAKIVAALDIPAIVPVYDFGEEDGQPYLVMRYMSGGSLTDQLQKGALSLVETARIVQGIAAALDEANGRGIIHRDLKPSNILFDPRGNPHISDFGAALMTQASMKLTDTGGAVGTPAYMSPEQIRGERKLDGRSDLYSLGIITFEALSGQHPYQTNTPIGVAVKHIIDPAPNILDTNPDLPDHCQAVLARAMAKDREDRYSTATTYAMALNQAALAGKTIVLSGDRQRSEFLPQPTQWQPDVWGRLVWIGLFALITLLIGGGILSANKSTTTVASLTTAATAVTMTEIETETEATTAVPTKPPATPQPAETATAVIPTQTSVPVVTVTSDVDADVTTVAPLAATAPQSASIYAEPNVSSPELAVIITGETIAIQGRSESGNWLYVKNDEDVIGFVYAARLGWDANMDALPIVETAVPNPPTAAPTECEGGCAQLSIDAYPLGGRCEGEVAYRTVFMRGQGGSGVYTYFWNGDQVAGPLEDEGYGFEVNNLSGAVIGRAKIVSSDGQTAEKELFISDFSCR